MSSIRIKDHNDVEVVFDISARKTHHPTPFWHLGFRAVWFFPSCKEKGSRNFGDWWRRRYF
jgi:hypothetical protein